MPDITMCQPAECPLKEKCYRYTAKPSNYQSYADFSEHLDGGKCKMFSPIFNANKEEA